MTVAKDPISPAAITVSRLPHNTDTDTDIPKCPPCDLWSDEPPLESDLHRDQIALLLECLKWLWQDRNNFYASGNLTIYYSEDKITNRDFRGPDFFVVLGADNHPRRSWMTWVEGGRYPNVIIELLSRSTAQVDRQDKKRLYQDIFRTPEYFWFHPETMEFKGFELVGGQYQALEPHENGHLWSEQLQLFIGVQNHQLRYFTSDGILVPTASERAESERLAKEKSQAQVDALKAKLQELGVDPETL